MRRQWSPWLKGTLFIGLLAMLGACSAVTTKSPAEPVGVTDANAGTEAKAESAVKTYKDFQGRETEIPVNPQRIAVIAGSGAVIDVKELGLEPVGYPHRYMSNSTILKSVQEDLSAHAPDIGMPTNLEQLVALSPDLMIFGYETQENEYDTLKKIGPVAAFDESVPLQERLATIGEIVGKQAEAKAILAELEQEKSAMWKKLREQGKIAENETAAVVVYYWNKKMFLMKNFGVFDLITHPMGFKMSDKVASLLKTSDSLYIELSEETLHDVLIADHLFMLYDNNEEAKQGFKQLKQSTVFQSLPPVKNGKVHYVPLEYNDSDLITTRKLIDVFPKILETEMFE